MPPRPASNRKVISISLPINHVRLIDSLADMEDRSRSGMIKHIISEYSRQRLHLKQQAKGDEENQRSD